MQSTMHGAFEHCAILEECRWNQYGSCWWKWKRVSYTVTISEAFDPFRVVLAADVTYVHSCGYVFFLPRCAQRSQKSFWGLYIISTILSSTKRSPKTQWLTNNPTEAWTSNWWATAWHTVAFLDHIELGTRSEPLSTLIFFVYWSNPDRRETRYMLKRDPWGSITCSCRRDEERHRWNWSREELWSFFVRHFWNPKIWCARLGSGIGGKVISAKLKIRSFDFTKIFNRNPQFPFGKSPFGTADPLAKCTNEDSINSDWTQWEAVGFTNGTIQTGHDNPTFIKHHLSDKLTILA